MTDETQEERELKKESERWKDYASVLLIAIPLLLGGLALSDQRTYCSFASGVLGFLGIIFVVLWYGRDKNYYTFIRGRKYPAFLVWASSCFGLQAGFLVVSFFVIR
jgi:hypothetical protein